MIALTFDDRVGGTAGEIVLGTSVGLALVGEVLGPAGLRRALTVAGEVRAEPDAPTTETPEPEPSS
jgi:hypothetical protein